MTTGIIAFHVIVLAVALDSGVEVLRFIELLLRSGCGARTAAKTEYGEQGRTEAPDQTPGTYG
ncbi:MAG: hypothetical protein JXL80_05720 [Planctomycetes bacterium]|nr:hypothetical protein [Planctomycetota bacterium]